MVKLNLFNEIVVAVVDVKFQKKTFPTYTLKSYGKPIILTLTPYHITATANSPA